MFNLFKPRIIQVGDFSFPARNYLGHMENKHEIILAIRGVTNLITLKQPYTSPGNFLNPALYPTFANDCLYRHRIKTVRCYGINHAYFYCRKNALTAVDYDKKEQVSYFYLKGVKDPLPFKTDKPLLLSDFYNRPSKRDHHGFHDPDD